MTGRYISLIAALIVLTILVSSLVLIWSVYGGEPNAKVGIKIIWTIAVCISSSLLYPSIKCFMGPSSSKIGVDRWPSLRLRKPAIASPVNKTVVPVLPSDRNDTKNLKPEDIQTLDELFNIDLNA